MSEFLWKVFGGNVPASQGAKDLLLVGVSIIIASIATYHIAKGFETEEVSSGHSLVDVVDLIYERLEPMRVEDVEALWNKYDQDNNGFLDLHEVRHLLSHLWEVQTDLVRADSAAKAEEMESILKAAHHNEKEISELIKRIRNPTELRVCECNLKKMREKDEAASQFFKEIDMNHERITKTEFLLAAPDSIRKALGLPLTDSTGKFLSQQDGIPLKELKRQGSAGDM
jgi:Ca2+-binding EF-hand superfamily protein